MDFIKARLKERTSLDGAMLIGGGIMMILAPVQFMVLLSELRFNSWYLRQHLDTEALWV